MYECVCGGISYVILFNFAPQLINHHHPTMLTAQCSHTTQELIYYIKCVNVMIAWHQQPQITRIIIKNFQKTKK